MEEAQVQATTAKVETLVASGNRYDPYIPVEYAWIDYERSWKKCLCGRVTLMRDNWCPACGKKLGMPNFDD